jgi:uncharacterized cysteine cluster protein YcgN (CxxCxxCC family)
MTEKSTKPNSVPFWRKPLTEMTQSEWESLCDGCGRCCLVKLEDEDTGRIWHTDLGCKLLRNSDCRCGDYVHRQSKVPDCIKLTPQTVGHLRWLPPTCAYKLLNDGKDLPWWHPLVSGSPETVHTAGISARGRISAKEDDVPLSEYADHIVAWPGRTPRTKAPVPETTPPRPSGIRKTPVRKT